MTETENKNFPISTEANTFVAFHCRQTINCKSRSACDFGWGIKEGR